MDSNININQSPLVTIKCLVYNHEPYLRQCLEGIVMQKTNFKFEAIVHDDASTDKSVDIIKEYANRYPDVIIPIYETENQYSKFDDSLSRIMNSNIRGKYTAICEGDDYWIDPFKLQKQVDYLENHLDYGMVHTQVKAYDQKNKVYVTRLFGRDFKTFDELLLQNYVCTLSVCYRSHFLISYHNDVPVDPNWKMGDYPLWLYISLKSKVHFIQDVTAVYRLLPNSASHSLDLQKNVDFELSCLSIQHLFSKLSNKEYLYPSILRNRIYELLKLHIIHDSKLDIKDLSEKLGISDLGFKNRLVILLSRVSLINDLLKKRWK